MALTGVQQQIASSGPNEQCRYQRLFATFDITVMSQNGAKYMKVRIAHLDPDYRFAIVSKMGKY
jgi:hypothetical protein